MQHDLQLTNTEKDMLIEVFDVMAKYAFNTRQFGVHLVHSHFTIGPDEVLYETHDKKKRKLFSRPIELSSFKKTPLATAWEQDQNKQLVVTAFCCDVNNPPFPPKHSRKRKHHLG